MANEELDALQKQNEKLQLQKNELHAKLYDYEKSKIFTSNEWYRYWRSALKDQATVTSGAFFLFAGAVLGYVISTHSLKEGAKIIPLKFNWHERFAVSFITLSLLCYALLAVTRYFDYRMKTIAYKQNQPFVNVLTKTKLISNLSIFFFLGQLILFCVGFGFEIREIYKCYF